MLKPIKDFENYLISDSGQIFSTRSERYLSINNNVKLDYPQIHLWKNGKEYMFYVHRLVAQTFIDNPLNLPEVNHIDGNRTNNKVSNLEWVTSSGNSYHASKTGLRTYTNRLTKDEFKQCLLDVIAGESYYSLSQRVPYKVPFLSTKLRELAKELNLEAELDKSLKEQRANRNRKVLAKINSKKVQRLSQ